MKTHDIGYDKLTLVQFYDSWSRGDFLIIREILVLAVDLNSVQYLLD